MLERLGERLLPEVVMVTYDPWQPQSWRARHQSHSGTELTQLDPRSNCLNPRTELKGITVGYGLQLVGDSRSGNSGAVMGIGNWEDSWCAGVGQRVEMAEGDSESLSLEMFNNRGGSCHCCLGCGSAWNQGAKWNSFFSNKRLNILKVKQSRRWWLRDSGWNLSHHQRSRHDAHFSVLSTGHGHLQSVYRRLIATCSLVQPTSCPFLDLHFSNLWPQPTSWPLLSYLLYFKTWQRNHRLGTCVWFLGTEVGWGVWEQGYSLGAPDLPKWSEENMHRMCVACSELLFNPCVV